MFWKLQENILEKEDKEFLIQFISSTDRFTQFEKVREFEAAWNAWQGSRYSVYVNSGSSANLIMISLMKELYGWADGDEVIVSSVTWVTNVAPVIQCGLRPVFCDVNLHDLAFDYEALEKKITPKTRAIFVTHLLGFPADIPRLEKMVAGRNIQIIEDCCESHGAKIGDKKIGNFGSLSSFSFYWGHHMTTVEGGMICTNNEDIYKLAVLKRSHGLARELPPQYHDAYKAKYPDIDFSFLFLTDGFNFRNTELHAVLGLAQLKHLDRYIQIRNDNYAHFIKMLEPYKEHFSTPTKVDGISSFSLPFLFKDSAKKKKFQAVIQEAGIESRPIISGNILRQPFLLRYKEAGDNFPNAEFIHENGFYVGNNQFVGKDRLAKLEELLVSFFKNNG